jgi:GNAT superfamily N-acetyltransferase
VESEIRRAREGDLARLREIERAAGQVFADVGLAEIAAHEPPSEEVLRRHLDGIWACGDPPIAYIFTEPVDGCLHIEQVSVHPDHARQGIGRALIEHVARLAGTAVTLTTFADVPWNGPYYERLGFRPLLDEELTGGLKEIRRVEIERGLDIRPRIAMRREAAGPSPA